jgi:hypothetical protein
MTWFRMFEAAFRTAAMAVPSAILAAIHGVSGAEAPLRARSRPREHAERGRDQVKGRDSSQ